MATFEREPFRQRPSGTMRNVAVAIDDSPLAEHGADLGGAAARVEFHPIANIFPLIEGAEFDQLVEDISLHGLADPVILHEGRILDGRNRYRALCKLKAHCDPQTSPELFTSFDGADPLTFVLSKNLKRRHLNEAQRASVAAKIANMRQGERTDLPSANLPKVAQPEAAKMLTISQRALRQAKRVHEAGVPELSDALHKGRIAVSTAAQVAELPTDEQRRILAREAPNLSKLARTEVKKFQRAKREQCLADKQQALPDRKYGVILADPEWPFRAWSEHGMDRAADNHYPTSSLELIKARPVASIAADDCVLWLWVVDDLLDVGIDVMRAWGFSYVASFIWGKDRIGKGYWNRKKHEQLLIGVRGNPPCPAPGTQYESLLRPRHPGAHSAKPDYFFQVIESYFPNLPKIELNRRGPPREGWDAWGNEVEEAANPVTLANG